MIKRPTHLALVSNPTPGGLSNDRMLGDFVVPHLLRRPELARVLTRAMSDVTDALALDEAAPSDLIDKIECAAATAMIEAYESIAHAAVLLARSTETIGTTEAAGALKGVEKASVLVSETTNAPRRRPDRRAQVVEDAPTATRAAVTSLHGDSLAASRPSIRQARTVPDLADDAFHATAIHATALSIMYKIAIDAAWQTGCDD